MDGISRSSSTPSIPSVFLGILINFVILPSSSVSISYSLPLVSVTLSSSGSYPPPDLTIIGPFSSSVM